MSSPKRATTSKAGGRNYDVEGKKLVSVTTVLGALDKPSLPNWYAKLAAERAIEQEATWHAIQEERGDEAARKWLSAAPRQARDIAALRGSCVHDMIERWPDSDDGLFAWYMDKLTALGGDSDEHYAFCSDAFVQYMRWAKRTNPTIIAREFTVADTLYGYAGTADMLCDIDGERWLIDVKTSTSVYNTNALQLSAYANAMWLLAEDGTLSPNPSADALHKPRLGVLHVRPDACVLHEAPNDAVMWQHFRDCLTLYHFAKRKDVLAPVKGATCEA